MSSNEKKTDSKPESTASESSGTTEKKPFSNDVQEKEQCMPKVTFTTFILSIASSGLVQLGEVPDPESGKTQENLVIAKHTIDVLTMLRDKTHSCLDEEEKQLMDGLLYELRMKYVLRSK